MGYSFCKRVGNERVANGSKALGVDAMNFPRKFEFPIFMKNAMSKHIKFFWLFVAEH